jgi:hypothetical protein
MRIVSRVVLLLALVWLVPHVALADSISVGDKVVLQMTDASQITGAGPLILTANNDPTTAFVTFCMQWGVGTWADVGSTLDVAGVTDFATWQSPSTGGDANGRDYLSSQTAWLYTQYRDGALAGFDGSVNASAALQWAIWQLQNEVSVPVGQTYSDLANSFIALADQVVADGFTGIGDVRVLNLVNADGTDAQDQLTLLPEPSSLELLALSAVALFIGRNRFALGRAREVI